MLPCNHNPRTLQGTPFVLSFPRLLLALLLTAILSSATLPAQVLTLTVDRPSAPIHQLVNLSASLEGPQAPGGTITFFDDATPVANVPLTPGHPAVFSTTALPLGPHHFTAGYAVPSTSPSRGGSALTFSVPVDVSITPLPAPFSVSPNVSTAYSGQALSLSILGLPSDATGEVQFSESGRLLATTAIGGIPVPRLQAFGDSITFGSTLSASAQRYPSRLAAALGLTLTDHALPGSLACDILPLQILPAAAGPTQASAPLSSLLVGTNDVDFHGTGPYETLFRTCHQATLAWLAIPREYKVLPGDPGASPLSGPWTFKPEASDATYATLYNDSGSGTARFTLTSSGGPLFLWYLFRDALSGEFTLSLDGVPQPTVYSSHPLLPVGSLLNPDDAGFALVRLPVPPGLHTLDVNLLSGSAGVLGVATPPGPGPGSVHPTVLVADLPAQRLADPASPQASISRYTQDIHDNLTLLQGDGLDLRSVSTGQFLLGTSEEMNDPVHPSALGHLHLAAAFQSALAETPLSGFAAFTNTPPSALLSLAQPGSHLLQATYTGDPHYAASTRSVSFTALARSVTTTSVSTPFPSASANTPIPFSVLVVPTPASGNVSLWDGTQFLNQAGLSGGTVTFSLSTLAPGLHGIFATYSGDSSSEASQSPPLALQINPAPSTLKLSPLPAHLTFGSPLIVTATLLPSLATGTITFTDTFTPPGSPAPHPQVSILGIASVLQGSAALSAPALAPGNHIFTAVYAGDASDMPATSPGLSVSVDPLVTVTTLISPSGTLRYRSPVPLSASVSPASATGIITLTDSLAGPLPPVLLVNGAATFTSSTFLPGIHTFTAAYAGDATHAPSTSASLLAQVSPAPSTTTLASLPATLGAGTPLTLSVAISPFSATGTVLFRDPSAGVLGQATVLHGLASLTLPALPSAAYAIAAFYSGDSLTAPSSSTPVPTQILPVPTATILAQVSPSLPFSAPLALTATVTPASASGLVRFSDNGRDLGSAPLLHGVSTYVPPNLAVGPHLFQASFSGDTASAPSSSAMAATTITPDPTYTTVTLAQANVPAGSVASFNIRVSTPFSAIPTGLVTLRSGATVLASGPLGNGTNGVAYVTLHAPTPALGTFPVTAFYAGDASSTPSDSSSAPLAYTVVPTPTSGTLILSASRIPPQTPITITANFTSVTGAIPTGNVLFTSGTNAPVTLATLPLDPSGSASFTLPAQPLGAYALSASLLPSGLFAPALASPQTLTVTPPLTLTLTPASLALRPGTSTTATLVLTPLSGFRGTATTACRTPYPWINCTIDEPAPLQGSPSTSTIHVTVHPNELSSYRAPPSSSEPLLVTLAALLPLAALGRGRRLLTRTRPALSVLLLTLLALASGLTGCATGGNFGQIPPGTQLLTIQATAAGVTSSTTLTLRIGP